MSRNMLSYFYRQAQASSMAICFKTEPVTLDPMGDAVFGMDARQDEVAGPRFLLCNHCESRYSYILHGCAPYIVLVRIYVLG